MVEPTLEQLYAEGQAVADVGHAPALHNILSGKDEVERSSLYSLDQHFQSPSCDFTWTIIHATFSLSTKP